RRSPLPPARSPLPPAHSPLYTAHPPMPLASAHRAEFKTSSPFSFVLFGASGNLAKLKIYPALYILALKQRLPKDFSIVGYARSEMKEDAFRKLVEDSIR